MNATDDWPDGLGRRALQEDHLAIEKEIKVRIPLPYHIKLHTIKVLHGQSISSTVRLALDAYFKSFEAPPEAPRRVAAWAEPEPEGSTPR